MPQNNLKRTLAPKETTILGLLIVCKPSIFAFCTFSLPTHFQPTTIWLSFLYRCCFQIVKSSLNILRPLCYIWHHFKTFFSSEPQQLLALNNHGRNKLSQTERERSVSNLEYLTLWRGRLLSYIGKTDLCKILTSLCKNFVTPTYSPSVLLFLWLVLLHFLGRLLFT